MLENLCHSDSAFVTLTYAEDKLPAGNSLMPKHSQDWLKRLRKEVYPCKIRYFMCGEYGEKSGRPHYHVALFGYPQCSNGQSDYVRPGGKIRASCCVHCDLIRDTWGHGTIFVGALTVESAQYVCGYVTKKMTRPGDARLHGRHPEFSRMSLRPGIGCDAMWEVASTLMQHKLDEQADVPSALRHGKRLLPLGRYLRRKLRGYVGKEEKAPQETIAQTEEEMRLVRALIPDRLPGDVKRLYAKELVMAISDGAVARLEARNRLWKKREEL